MKKKGPAWERYDQQNREAAEIILADPERYAGICLEWAQLWHRNHPIPKTGNSLWKDWIDAGRKRA